MTPHLFKTLRLFSTCRWNNPKAILMSEKKRVRERMQRVFLGHAGLETLAASRGRTEGRGRPPCHGSLSHFVPSELYRLLKHTCLLFFGTAQADGASRFRPCFLLSLGGEGSSGFTPHGHSRPPTDLPLPEHGSEASSPTSGLQNSCSGMFTALFKLIPHHFSEKSTPVGLFKKTIFKMYFSPD